MTNPTTGQAYPRSLDTPAKRALFDNLDQDEALALAVDGAVRGEPAGRLAEQCVQGQEGQAGDQGRARG